MWSLLEIKSRGQSTTVERSAVLQDLGIETLRLVHLTRVGLAASLVSPLAESRAGQSLGASTSAPSLSPAAR